ncbi:MAG: hypothetical protein SGARI_002703 [Bacillariaceae sp.]
MVGDVTIKESAPRRTSREPRFVQEAAAADKTPARQKELEMILQVSPDGAENVEVTPDRHSLFKTARQPQNGRYQADAELRPGDKYSDSDQTTSHYSEIGETPSLQDETSLEIQEPYGGNTRDSTIVTPASDTLQVVTANESSDSAANAKEASSSIQVASAITPPKGKRMVSLERLDEKAVYLCLSSGKYYRLVEVVGDEY